MVRDLEYFSTYTENDGCSINGLMAVKGFRSAFRYLFLWNGEPPEFSARSLKLSSANK